MSHAREFDGFSHELAEIDFDVMAFAALVAYFTGLENLLDGAKQAVGVRQHQTVKLLALRFVHIATLHGFEVEANGGDWSLQFVRDGVDEAAVLFVAADFAHQEDGVEDHAGNDGEEKYDAEEEQDAFAPVEDDPADVQGDGEGHQRAAQHDEKCDGLSAASDLHGV